MRENTAFQGQTVLQIGSVQVNFYVREPSPNWWNAIGVVCLDLDSPEIRQESSCRMIVGTGPSRDEAIGDLITRVLTGEHPALRKHSKEKHSVRALASRELN